MIQTFIAYDLKGDLGAAYNQAMSLLGDEDWGVFLDHDAMMVQRDWFDILNRAIESNPQYGLFTCMTNRVWCHWQVLRAFETEAGMVDPRFETRLSPNEWEHGPNWNNHDIEYHMELGRKIPTEVIKVTDVTTASPRLSGVFMAIKGGCWSKAGGAKSGFLTVDNDIHDKVAKTKYRVGIINQLYVYHWYRGDNPKFRN